MNDSSAPANTPAHALEEHLLLLSEVELVMHEENSLLKQTGQPPDDAFIRRKSLLLPLLEASLSALRSRAARQELSPAARNLLRDAQRKLHKVLLLDRENEGLLLRCTLHNGGLPSGPVKIGAGQLARAYDQYRG